MNGLGPLSQKAWNDFTESGKVQDYLRFSNVREIETGTVPGVMQNMDFGVRSGDDGVLSSEFGVPRDM